ncbi:MAG: hypothetical protein KGZ25_13285, partial [Planctomycetes bacterium]|nr:hypothetical protein [Planctomycetota bacterium]
MEQMKQRMDEVSLALEQLERRLLLDAVNPGEPAELYDGDQLFFVQGESSETPSDYGGDPVEDWVIVASYYGSGSAQLYNSSGQEEFSYGDKIGNIEISDANRNSNLVVEQWQFKEGFGLDSLGDVGLSDQPDTVDEAAELSVPEGDSGAEAVYNTGRLVVSASGEDVDYYKFTGEEAEKFSASISTSASVEIGVQYGQGTISWHGSQYELYNDNGDAGDDAQDEVTVYVHVTGTGAQPYSLIIDRQELNFTFPADADGNQVSNETTTIEDLPESASGATDLNYSADNQTGIGVATPTVTLFGDGAGTSGHD